jgi:hypothetical protein
MKITCKSKQDAAWNADQGWHIFTYAEAGFSPLDIHGQHFGLSRDRIAAFADEVNSDQNLGTLLPDAPITAVPSGMIRGYRDAEMLAGVISAFLRLNEEQFKATRLAFDFRTPRVPVHAVEAIRMALEDAPTEDVEVVVVLDDI